MGTVTSLSMSAPRPKHFVGRVRAEEPDPEDPEDPGDPASSPSLLDERMKKCAHINLSKDVTAYSCHFIIYLLDCYWRPER